jgi:7,8-dihydro-6-hydroxymethylpterin-pyrophosphokinase
MLHYFVSLGCNLNPVTIQSTLTEIGRWFSPIHISRLLQKEKLETPVGGFTYTLVASFNTEMPSSELRRFFNTIEAKLNHNCSSHHQQMYKPVPPVGLDILMLLPVGSHNVDSGLLPHGLHIRPLLIELLHYLKIECHNAWTSHLERGVPFRLAEAQLGENASTVDMDTFA